MNVRKQQILNPKKLRAARFVSRISGHFKPAHNANSPINKTAIKKILIQEHQCIGDVIMLEPALAAIKKAFSNAELVLLCAPSVKDLAIKTGLADVVYAYPDETPLTEKFDLAFDFHGDVRRLKRLTEFRSTFYAGFSFSGGAKWLTHVVDYPYEEHQVERPFVLLGQMNVPVERKVPELKGIEKNIRGSGKILLHPGANHEGRKWPQSHWDALIDLLSDDKQNLLWITPPGEAAPANIETFQGNLIALAELISASSLLVGCDSMSVHLAAALGVPALAIFGSQDPELTKPYGPNGYFILPEEECRHRKSDWRLCKECMKSVRPEDVYTKINSILIKK